MATPMNYQDSEGFMCCLCFSFTPRLEATFDDYPTRPTLVNVCFNCRMGETYWAIRKGASYGY